MVAGFIFLLSLNIACQKAPKHFEIHRGTNISHWLSQSDKRGDARRAWFTEADVKWLAEIGFDHLRIPIDEEQMWDENGKRHAEAFELLNFGLDWCAKYGLRAVVDLHILRSHYFNAKIKPLWTDSNEQEKFVNLWLDLSDALHSRPVGLVAYELMNEAVADDPEQWNQLIAKVHAAIRKQEPTRVIVIGSNRWQSVDTFDALRIPGNDPNIILSFHFYTPFLLTHYKASWTNIKGYTGPVHYSGITVIDSDLKGLPADLLERIGWYNGYFDAAVLDSMLVKPLRKHNQTGLRLYCGEWGALPTAPKDDRLRWYRDMRTMLEKHDIAWASWDYKGSFGIKSRDGRRIYQDLVDILLSGNE